MMKMPLAARAAGAFLPERFARGILCRGVSMTIPTVLLALLLSSAPPARGPLPDRGAIPPVAPPAPQRSADELEQDRRESARFERELRSLRKRCFHTRAVAALRDAGIADLARFTQPTAFRPMAEVLLREKDDVRRAVLDHLGAQGEAGQIVLAELAISHDDGAIRNESLQRLTKPASAGVLREIERGLRSRRHSEGNNAASVAVALGAREMIPLMIFTQVTRDPRPSDEGDLAWIAIETQHAFVADVRAVVSEGSVALIPVPGVIHEGSLLRVMDAVVITYRTIVHQALVNLTTLDTGESTEHLGYDQEAWREWYRSAYPQEPPEESGG